MKHHLNASLPFLLLCYFVLYGQGLGHDVRFYVHNKCPFPIWPAAAPNAGKPVIAAGGFYLPPGETKRVDAPWGWTGRLWARTGCNFNSNWNQACETGDCDGRLECNGLIGKPPVTLVQLALQTDGPKPNFYDVSIVDGYNLPVSVASKPASSICTIAGCNIDLNYHCPRELQVKNKQGETVACKSACLAFDLDAFCCRNEFGTPNKCKPNTYSMWFKEACPSYYSYAYDTPAPLKACLAKEYVITFCPNTWGKDASESDLDDMHTSF